MTTARHEPRPLRPSLESMLADHITGCTACGACVDECGFLKLYGTPP